MSAILVSVALLAAPLPTRPDAPPAALAGPAHETSVGREQAEMPAAGVRPSAAIWRAATTWWMPVVRKSYAPGTLPSPSGSWYKHPYLAYRGNFYTAGYDYRREFDYPWHTTRACQPPLPARPVVVPLEAPPPATDASRHKARPTVGERTRGASSSAKR